MVQRAGKGLVIFSHYFLNVFGYVFIPMCVYAYMNEFGFAHNVT